MVTKNILKDVEKGVRRYVEKDIPRIAGKMAVDEFRENFHRQGFRNNGITPWRDVKRRDSQSPWYGFLYKGEKRTSVAVTKDKKSGRLVRSKKQRKLNFSQAATKRGILIGSGSNLMNSIRVAEASSKRVVIGSDLPYSKVHNEGGYIRVFGKAKKKLPKRQFIGESRELMNELEKKIMGDIDRIIDQNFNP